MAGDPDDARIDQWLWSVRLYRTRSAAKDACERGRVRVDDEAVKPARRVEPGARVEVRLRRRVRILEVVRPIRRRVGAGVAATCYVDHSPPEPERTASAPVADAGRREQGSGRPTKRDRRAIDRLRRR